MSQIKKIEWAISIGALLLWTTIACGFIPGFAALVDGEVWLTNHATDPILLAFVSGLLLATLAAPSLWADVGSLLKRGVTFFAAQKKHISIPRHVAHEPAVPKLVAPKIAAPEPVLSAPVAAKFVAPKIAAPKPAARKTVAPRISAPKSNTQMAAQFDVWDELPALKTWQVAWLWNGWEPSSEIVSGKPCYPRYRCMEEHLDAGMIANAVQKNGSWKDAELARQDLVDYAIALGERPQFLFPEERQWFSRELHKFQKRDVEPSSVEEYETYSDAKLELFKFLQIINSEAVAQEVVSAMRSGNCEGIARRQSGGVTFGFERIPQYAWRTLKIDWLGNVTGKKTAYCDLRVKFKEGYLNNPQEADPAVETYAAIDEFLDMPIESAAQRQY